MLVPTIIGGNWIFKYFTFSSIEKNKAKSVFVPVCFHRALNKICYVNSSSLCFAVLSNEFFPKFTSKIITITPLIGVILTTLLCASPVSLKNLMTSFSWRHISGLSLSLADTTLTQFPYLFSEDRASRRCAENSGSTVTSPCGGLACCSVFSGLPDFKIFIWWINIQNHFDRMWNAGSYLFVLLSIPMN